MRETFNEKINRILNGGKPRILDLFAGCGGISLGFHAAGFEIAGAVEIDEHAAKTHEINFGNPETDKHEFHAAKDITKIDPEDLFRTSGLAGNMESWVDVIVGGPPCQAFARVGRAKLREIAEHPQAFLQDPRSNLYMRYLDYVRELMPIAILMENVPDVLNFGGHNIAEEVAEALTSMGYKCRYTLLNSAMYGVPQMRERMFLMAYVDELQAVPEFPSPTHWVDLPQGYQNSRKVATKTLFNENPDEDAFFIPPVLPLETQKILKPAVTAKDALEDLPKITLHLKDKLKRGARRFTDLIPYPKGIELNDYAKLMREWKGFENMEGLKDHVIRYLPRDYKIFRRMEAGDQYPEAFQLAQQMFEEEMVRLKMNGISINEGSPQFLELWKKFVPPYDPGKFPNKWRKMEADFPARTLMAHLGKDGYSHIHYDSEQARTISVREAARLQSFPDGFIFSGTMNPAFRQIGNAVPPLMANAIALKMMNILSTDANAEETSRQTVNTI